MQEIVIKLAPGAEKTALTGMIADIIRGNLDSKPEKLKDFKALRANVNILAEDAKVEITLDFRKGELEIFSGKEGKSQISIKTDSATLLDLTNIRIKAGLPNFFDSNGREVIKKILRGDLRIKGLFTRTVSLIRLTKVLSVA